MKNLILKTFPIIIISLFLISCKKQEVESFPTNGGAQTKLEKLSSSPPLNKFEVGGTLGCGIRYIEDRNNDKYEECLDKVLSQGFWGGVINIPINPNLVPPSKPCYLCTLPAWWVNHQFWEFVGLREREYSDAFSGGTVKKSLSDKSIKDPLSRMKREIFKLNAVLYKIFVDGNGELKIPTNYLIRRDMIINYNGYGTNEDDVKAEDLLVYSSFVYEDEFFEFPAIFDSIIFSVPDINGKTSLRDYGIKVVYFQYKEK